MHPLLLLFSVIWFFFSPRSTSSFECELGEFIVFSHQFKHGCLCELGGPPSPDLALRVCMWGIEGGGDIVFLKLVTFSSRAKLLHIKNSWIGTVSKILLIAAGLICVAA